MVQGHRAVRNSDLWDSKAGFRRHRLRSNAREVLLLDNVDTLYLETLPYTRLQEGQSHPWGISVFTQSCWVVVVDSLGSKRPSDLVRAWPDTEQKHSQ